MQPRQLAGLEALEALSDLLQRARNQHPTWGALEAADAHWSWRADQRTDPRDCTVWYDADGRPLLAVTAVRFRDAMLADIVRLPLAPIPTEAIEQARDLAGRHRDRTIDWPAPTDDPALIDAYLAIGGEPIEEWMVATWIDSDELAPVPACPTGYQLRTRAEVADTVPHHMVPRNGTDVEQRLRESTLYRADLDLWVSAADGSPAGYALFWADPRTGVGLVEPMRVADDHQRRGLARFLLLAGAHRLAEAGCTRVKVSYMADNPAAERTYLGAGFRPASTIQTYQIAASV